MPRLLFVDDKVNAYVVWGIPLQEDYGWEVTHASGPREAKEELEKAEAEGRPYDVAIIDRRLSDDLDQSVGDDLLKDIAARWRYVCLVMLTAYGGEMPAAEATRHGAYRYLLKGTPVKTIDRVCRKGMQMQLSKRIRRTLLYPGSLEQLVREVKSRIAYLLPAGEHRIAYLESAPGGAFLIRDDEPVGAEPARPIDDARQEDQPLLANFPVAEEVKSSGRYLLRTKRADIAPADGILMDSPGSQLIIPVTEEDDPTAEDLISRKATRVVALLWIESAAEDAFDDEDGEMLTGLADFVGIAIARAREMNELGAKGREDERNGLLSEVAHRICNPLQIAQSNIDLLTARIHRHDEVAPEDLRGKLESALTSIVQAIQAAEQLRQGSQPRTITLRPTALTQLVEQAEEAFRARAEAAHCEIRTERSATIPLVELDPAEMRYALNCILENALTAIQQKQHRNHDESMKGLIQISLSADPETRSVLLSVRDNGCGISPKNQSRVFERYFSTKEQDFRRGKHGLGLWEARRFVEAAQGVIEARSTPGEGTDIQIIFPACEENARARQVNV